MTMTKLVAANSPDPTTTAVGKTAVHPWYAFESKGCSSQMVLGCKQKWPEQKKFEVHLPPKQVHPPIHAGKTRFSLAKGHPASAVRFVVFGIVVQKMVAFKSSFCRNTAGTSYRNTTRTGKRHKKQSMDKGKVKHRLYVRVRSRARWVSFFVHPLATPPKWSGGR